MNKPWTHRAGRAAALAGMIGAALLWAGQLPHALLVGKAAAASAAEVPPPPPPPPTEEPPVTPGTPPPTTPGTPPPPSGGTPAPEQAGGGRQLLLPEISFIGTVVGKLSTDHRDKKRDRLKLQEAEINIQSYVYPNVRAEAQVTADGDEDYTFKVEQAFLRDEQLMPGLSGTIGRFYIPFGRTNQLHRHSWLYVRRPLVLQNFVAPESLGGDGVDASWLLPTGSKLFVQLDAGTYGNANTEEAAAPDVAVEMPGSDGAQIRDKFSSARLWAAYPPTAASEVEAGASWLEGRGFPRIDGEFNTSPNIRVTGVDLSYRRFGMEAQRLLLRSEYLWYHDSTGLTSANGYYAFADYRLNKYNEFGLLYDWSGIPLLPGLHESALSAIYTRQFTEQTYGRLQFTHGDRPGKENYNEVWLELVWGMGPHTHNLE